MKKTLVLIFLLLLISGNGFANNIEQPDYKALLEVRKTTVEIYGYSGANISGCSGVLIRSNIALTAKHCAVGYEEIYVDNHKVKSVIISPSKDIAVLITEEPVGNHVVKIANKMIDSKQYVFGYGRPFIDDYFIAGIYLRTTHHGALTVGTIIPGCSGAGVFNSKGELVGVWSADMPKLKLIIFEDLDEVRKFLKDNSLL